LNQALGRNTAWMLASQLARTVVQAVYFVLVARTLGVDEYGAFVAATALVMIAAPFVSLGSGFIMIKHVSRRPETFSRYFSNGLLLVLGSGGALVAVCVGIAAIALPSHVPLGLVAIIAIAELLCARIIELTGQVFVAFEQLRWTATLQFALSVVRLLAIAVIAGCVASPDAFVWSLGYLGATLVAMVFALVVLHREHRLPRLTFDRASLELHEGIYFAIGLSAQTIYNDIDKTFVSRISGLAAAGTYGAAYRIVDVCFAPVSALLAATYADFFRRGERGLRGSLAVARRLLPLAGAYATVAMAIVMVCAPLVPRLLGQSYEPTVEAVRWLAPLLVLRSVHYFLADALSGAGQQRARSYVQVAIALLNIVLLVALVPTYGWRGAAWVSLACDGLLCVGLAVTVRHLAATSS
jgi:O-antigen/teichoic acid export membrane protein